jgi:putative aldouronate transport system substrate-binding protein
MKKSLVWFFSLVVLMSMAGFGVTLAAPDKKEPLVLTMFSYDVNFNNPNFEDPVGKKITERTGVKVNIEYPVGDAEQKVTVMIAGGDYPDLVAHKGAAKFVDAKAFVNLTPYIEKYGKNLKKLYGPYMKRLRYSLQDKSIYYLGSFGVGTQFWDVNGFQLQHGVVKELGYPRMKTVKDFEKAIREYKEKHPTIDGQPTIGLSLLADDWRFWISVTNQAVFATGGPDDGQWYVNPKTGKAIYHFTRPEEKEYFRWLNHMNDIGLLDPDSFTQKYDQYKAKIASGRVLALTDAKWEYGDAERSLRQAGKFERTYGNYPIVLDERFRRADLQDPGYAAGFGIGITTKCKDKVKAFKFLDWLASDEAQILINWGIKDVNYKIIDGKRVIPPDEMARRNNDPLYGKKNGIGLYDYPFPERGDGVLDPTGNPYTTVTKESIKQRYSEIEKEVLAAYGAKMWMDLYPQAKEFPVKPWGVCWQIPTPQIADYTVPMQKCDDLCKKRIPEMIMAKPEQFDELWNKFQKELNDFGVHKAEAIFNKVLAEHIKLWNN